MSKKQKELRLTLQSTVNKQERLTLKAERNKVMREIHYKRKVNKNAMEMEKIKDIENAKNDSNRMFKAIRVLQRGKPKEKLIIKENGENIINEKEITNKITEFFKEMFQSDENEVVHDIEPKEMIKRFTADEVEAAVLSLKNNKSAGSDGISAE